MSRDTRRWTACVCVRNAEGWTKKVWQQKSTLSPKLFLDLSSLCSAFSSTLSFATKAMWRRTAAYLVGCRSSSPRSSSVAGFRCPIFALNLKHLIYTHQKFLSNDRHPPLDGREFHAMMGRPPVDFGSAWTQELSSRGCAWPNLPIRQPV